MASIEQLQASLSLYGVDTSGYGHGATKSIQQLFEELGQGKSSLIVANGMLVRVIKLLELSIRRVDGYILTEKVQTFHATPQTSKHVRRRGTVLMSRIFSDESTDESETLETTVRKTIHHNLGVELGKRELVYNLTTNAESRDSKSYPGLCSCYATVRVEISADQLPFAISEGYRHTKYFGDGITPRVTTMWGWEKRM